MRIDPPALQRWHAETAADADVSLVDGRVRPLSSDRFDVDPGPFREAVAADEDAGDGVRTAIGDSHGRSAEETLLAPGARAANFLALAALVDEHAVVVTPTDGAVPGLADALGEVTRVRLDAPGWALDPDAVEAAIRPETELVAVANPNGPAGRYHDAAAMRAVYDACADNGSYLLCDERARYLASDPIEPVASFGRYGISTGGVATAFGLPGLRFGWLCGPAAVVAAAGNWRAYTTASPSALDRHVAGRAFDRREELLSESRGHVAENRALVASFVDEHGLAWSDPDCGATALVAVPDGFAGGRSFCRSLVAEASVALAPGEAFGCPGWARIGFGGASEDLNEGLSRLGAFLERHR
jgi:aspartate/methionine/tyrosine aminotransferase